VKRYLSLSVTCVIACLLAGAASAQQQLEEGPITVGILLLNKPFITEFAGPLDVYHHVPAEKIKVFIVSDTDKEQVTYEGMPFRANYTFGNAPKIDVLVVPSGAGSLDADQKNVAVSVGLKRLPLKRNLLLRTVKARFCSARLVCSTTRMQRLSPPTPRICRRSIRPVVFKRTGGSWLMET
jgi:hypothetical protein